MNELFDFVMGKAGNINNVRDSHVFLQHIYGDCKRFCLLAFFPCAVESGEFIVAGFTQTRKRGRSAGLAV